MLSRLKDLRNQRGWTQEQAAEAMGVSRGQYIKLERGERRMTIDYMQRASQAFGVTIYEVVKGGVVPVVGYVSAGNAAIFYEGSQDWLDEAPEPPGSTDTTVAVVVRGDSMAGKADDGDIIYYDDRRYPPTDDLIGRLCVIGLPDDRVVVKKLYRAATPGLYNLHSTNTEPMLDVPVSWAALVRWIKPR